MCEKTERVQVLREWSGELYYELRATDYGPTNHESLEEVVKCIVERASDYDHYPDYEEAEIAVYAGGTDHIIASHRRRSPLEDLIFDLMEQAKKQEINVENYWHDWCHELNKHKNFEK